MARLHEYQGKQLLREAGVPVPKGAIALRPSEAREIAVHIGTAVAIKAQIWATGRFKAGGIRFAETPDEAEKAAFELLGSRVKGLKVDKVLVEERLGIEEEFYAGISVDASHKVRAPLVIFSTKGGVNIEEVAPEYVCRHAVDILQGLDPKHVRDLVSKLSVPSDLVQPVVEIVAGLYNVFRRYDARSAEINPLVFGRDGRIVAADCRISIDDASVWRHPELGIAVPRESDSPPTDLDMIAWQTERDDYRGVSFFVQMVPDTSPGGYIGFHAIGGGGALLAADTLARHGLMLANYAETSGNPPAAKVYRTAKIILSQPGLVGYCLIGAVIASQDQWHHAHGLVKAFREVLIDRPGFPVVILIAGNKEEEALRILRDGLSDLPIRLAMYGREHIHQLDKVAKQVKAWAGEYQVSHPEQRAAPKIPPSANHGLRFDFRTGNVLVNLEQCTGCRSFACIKACSLYGGYLLRLQKGQPSLGVPLDEVPRLCNECLACESECRLRGQAALSIELPIQGL